MLDIFHNPNDELTCMYQGREPFGRPRMHAADNTARSQPHLTFHLELVSNDGLEFWDRARVEVDHEPEGVCVQVDLPGRRGRGDY